ncbi:MAG TPA: S-methyl-5'-thioadenosine phosphorylase [Thermodesulfovibrionales bacterium]|nr:S-methyl-5'-thioadenosine phosphorylase [Thermodesulfovibrionales bacterium]
MPKVGIIAGSGFYEIEGVGIRELRKIDTPFGEPSDVYRICDFSGREFVFLSRHGTPHHIPPHRVNYRANLWGFKALGVARIFAVNAVGGINRAMAPGDIVIPDQCIDMTHGRASTFYEGDEVVHIDLTDPYCGELRGILLRSGEERNADLNAGGTYACMNGPRLETRAEIEFLEKMGADIVGMTAMPEVCLARELEICFAGIAVVTNHAAGISGRKLTTTEVVETMKGSLGRVKGVLMAALPLVPEERNCECSHALGDARI